MANFFSGILSFLENIFELVELPAPYGFSFSANGNPFSINTQLATAQIGCGVVHNTGFNN